MVVFTCSHCGDSVQKPRVEKHYYQCRRPIALTCVDCFKDFHGDEFKSHTSCVTEAERYSAKGFKSKPPSNKGEIKQLEWIETIKNVQENKKTKKPSENYILSSLTKFSNVPRKKKPFFNFMKNTMPTVNPADVESVYDLLDIEHKSRCENKTSETIVKNHENTNDSDKTNNKKRKLPTSDNVSNKKIIKEVNICPEFKWKATILHFVREHKNIKLSKLQNKVLETYMQFCPKEELNSEIIKHYNKKLAKVKNISVVNNKAVLN